MNRTFWKELWLLLVCIAGGLAALPVAYAPLELYYIYAQREPNVVFSMHFLQWMQTFLVMLIPAFVWYRWRFKKDAVTDFGFRRFEWRSMCLTFFLMLCMFPAMEFITYVCYTMPLPQPLQDMMNAAKIEEFEAMNIMLGSDGILMGWVEPILLVSIATAIGEEAMFRGAVYKCFDFTSLNKHWVAILVGLIFSLIHFDISGFVPRWILGTLFCYLVIWTGSIWPCILAHAMNNLFSLIEFRLEPVQDPLDPPVLFFSWYITLLSFIAVIALIFIIQKQYSRHQEMLRHC